MTAPVTSWTAPAARTRAVFLPPELLDPILTLLAEPPLLPPAVRKTRTFWCSSEAAVESIVDHERRCRRAFSRDLFACAQVSRAWSAAAIPHIWRSPYISGDIAADRIMDVLCLPNEENPSSPTLDRPRPHRCSHVRELRLEDVTAPHMLPLVETLCRDSDGRTPAPRLLQLSDRLSCATHLTHHSVVHLLSAIDPLDGEGPLSLVVGSPFDNIVEAGISSALNSLPGGVRELRSLDVADAPWAGDRFLQAVLRHCPHLETLDVGRLLHYGDAKTVTGLGARLLAQGAQRLRCLSLAGLPETSVNASTLSALLVALGGCLTSLCIARCPGVDDAACEAIRDHSLALVDLDMTGCVGVSGRGWTNMLRGASPDGVKGPLIGRLRELSIARCALRDAEVAVLVEGAAALRLLDVTQGSEQPEDDRGHDLGSVLADGLIAGCRNLEFLIMDGRCKETVGVAQVVVALCLGLKKLKLVYHGIALDEREIVAGYRARVPLEEGSGISSINSFSEHWKRDLTQEAWGWAHSFVIRRLL